MGKPYFCRVPPTEANGSPPLFQWTRISGIICSIIPQTIHSIACPPMSRYEYFLLEQENTGGFLMRALYAKRQYLPPPSSSRGYPPLRTTRAPGAPLPPPTRTIFIVFVPPENPIGSPMVSTIRSPGWTIPRWINSVSASCSN